MKAMIVFEVDNLDDVVVYTNIYKREQGWKRQIGRLECVKPVPMPEQMTWGHTADYIYGWNDCLEEITGERE